MYVCVHKGQGHRREKESLTEGAKICRFIDYVVKFKNSQSYFEFTNILSEKCGSKALMAPMGNLPMGRGTKLKL